MSYRAGVSFAKDAPAMVFGSLLPKRPRKVREELVRAMADALNTLDYARAGELVIDDVVVFNARRGTTEGRDAFIERDKTFRQGAGMPQIVIDDLIHHDEEVLVTGRLESDNPEVGGPTMWRVAFEGEKIARIEITRADKTDS